MHPDISVLPSRVFYDGNLADGPDMAIKTAQPWHASSAFGPYRFINVNSSREMTGYGHSLKNQVEADVALQLYMSLKDQYPTVDFDFRVGIVTMSVRACDLGLEINTDPVLMLLGAVQVQGAEARAHPAVFETVRPGNRLEDRVSSFSPPVMTKTILI